MEDSFRKAYFDQCQVVFQTNSVGVFQQCLLNGFAWIPDPG